jgi:hypothetical protein
MAFCGHDAGAGSDGGDPRLTRVSDRGEISLPPRTPLAVLDKIETYSSIEDTACNSSGL